MKHKKIKKRTEMKKKIHISMSKKFIAFLQTCLNYDYFLKKFFSLINVPFILQ